MAAELRAGKTVTFNFQRLYSALGRSYPDGRRDHEAVAIEIVHRFTDRRADARFLVFVNPYPVWRMLYIQVKVSFDALPRKSSVDVRQSMKTIRTINRRYYSYLNPAPGAALRIFRAGLRTVTE